MWNHCPLWGETRLLQLIFSPFIGPEADNVLEAACITNGNEQLFFLWKHDKSYSMHLVPPFQEKVCTRGKSCDVRRGGNSNVQEDGGNQLLHVRGDSPQEKSLLYVFQPLASGWEQLVVN